ncbi:MAG: alpha/beta hydrolase family protein, partial [Planctomycetaceae bacterium]
MPLLRLCLVLLLGSLWSFPARGQPAGGADLLKRFDKNGNGRIDDDERRAVREKMRQRQSQPGAMTPSGQTVTMGDREVTELEYASSDGRKIPCVLSMPRGEGPFPLLVTIHGGQGNRDLAYLRTMAAPGPLSPTIAAFNKEPWGILAISYRSGNGALFGKEHDDVIAGIRFGKQLSRIDPARVGVVGGSHGGHLALLAAEKLGREFLCVAVGSPWMTDPLVYMLGDPNRAPLSLVPQPAREELQKNGRSLFQGLTRGRGLSEPEAREFLAKNSIEANAESIEIPTLFITSRGDDQAPHALIEPLIERLRKAGKTVTVYTAEKSPHGFYWARTVSAARAERGAKTPQEQQEEDEARATLIRFFREQFARTNATAGPADKPAQTEAPRQPGDESSR